MKVVYFHGFGSVGLSKKSQDLIDRFGREHVVCPDLPIDPTNVMRLVDDIVRSNTDYPLVFVGTSLGGFYANFFSQLYDVPCVLVNPSTQPSTSFADRIGDHINYATGETISVTQEILNTWREMERITASTQNGALISLFLAVDDEELLYTDALKNIPYTSYQMITPTGGHRFADNWDLVIQRIEELA